MVDAPRTLKISSQMGQLLAKRALSRRVEDIRNPGARVHVPRGPVSDQEVFNEFSRSGFSYRGTVSTGFQKRDRGARLKGKIDFLSHVPSSQPPSEAPSAQQVEKASFYSLKPRRTAQVKSWTRCASTMITSPIMYFFWHASPV